jgi:hypothetical protein
MSPRTFLEALDAALRGRMSAEPVRADGAWRRTARRAYASPHQSDKGSGPFLEIEDARWRATLTSARPLAALVMLLTGNELDWVKAPEIRPDPEADVSLHAYADWSRDRATFAARLAGATTPGVAVPAGGDLVSGCRIHGHALVTGRVCCLAEMPSAAIFVLLLPADAVTVGRKRLWRLRPAIARELPDAARVLLTRRRTGQMRDTPGIRDARQGPC